MYKVGGVNIAGASPWSPVWSCRGIFAREKYFATSSMSERAVCSRFVGWIAREAEAVI